MNNQRHSSSSGYEQSDVNIKRLFVISLLVIITIVCMIWFLNEYFFAVREKLVYEMVLRPESVELRELRAHEAEVLSSYKILDEAKGVYQIPIQQAMEIIALEKYQQAVENKWRP